MLKVGKIAPYFKIGVCIMNKIFFLLVFVIGLYAEMVSGVSAVVKGNVITLYDLKAKMQESNINAHAALDILIRKKLEESEIKQRGINVESDEVYEDIKQTAQRNNLSVDDFYKAIREKNGITSTQLKEDIKNRILSQKLYASIAYSHVSKPTEDELKEYFELHKIDFNHPKNFNVIIYVSSNKSRLQQKIENPMFYAPDIQTNEQQLPYDRISVELSSLLSKTPVSKFTPIVPNGKGGFMSFYIKSIDGSIDAKFEDIKEEISNIIMDNQRESVLSDYFARLRHNADIKILRLPN
jgi:hypothetical protein